MKMHERVFRLTLGLGLLPERTRRWLFSSGTRALEVLNALCMLAWPCGCVCSCWIPPTPAAYTAREGAE